MSDQSNYNIHSRVENNINAINSLLSNHPNLEMLKYYTGWGGLKEAIYTPAIYKRLKAVLSEGEIKSIKGTLKSSYYTPTLLVDFIYKIVAALGCKPDSVLEPSAGHGVFIERMPTAMRNNAEITAVELDCLSCKLLQTLYPDITVRNQGFETFLAPNKYGLIVGNPPFGQFYVHDQSNPDLSEFSIHHFFVAKSMRLLKDNGVLAMIVPRYFLDSYRRHVRHIIAKEGGALVAAYRLPENLFDDAIVTVDIVFLQKTKTNINWLNAERITHGDKQAFINQYFLERRENILGEIEFFDIYGRNEITCKGDGDVFSKLDEKAAAFSARMLKTKNVSGDNSRVLQSLAAINKKIATIREDCKKLIGVKSEIDQLSRMLANLQKLTSTI